LKNRAVLAPRKSSPILRSVKMIDAAYCQVQSMENVEFAQLLVRFDYKETPSEYIVFEKLISDEKSSWRIAGRMHESKEYF